jgi:hypothetical protein
MRKAAGRRSWPARFLTPPGGTASCPAGQILSHQALPNRENRVHTHGSRAKQACPHCPLRGQCARMAEVDYPPRRTGSNDGLQNQDEDRRGAINLRSALADRRVPPRLDQRALRLATVSLTWPAEGSGGSHLGMPQLQPHKVVQYKMQVEPGSCVSTSLTTASKELVPMLPAVTLHRVQHLKTPSPHPNEPRIDFFTASRRPFPWSDTQFAVIQSLGADFQLQAATQARPVETLSRQPQTS